MSGYDPVSLRVRPLLLRLHRDSVKGKPLTVPFATACAALSVPTEIRPRLLRLLLSEGFVTEELTGQVRLTALGTAQVSTPRA